MLKIPLQKRGLYRHSREEKAAGERVCEICPPVAAPALDVNHASHISHN